uniref:Cell division protein ZapA n=1 Tax=Candidatus Kentrum sp. FM TaxID=2126340 RepID=A0A450SMA2_9GAMM|nr:MAG: cell division protein ZapA [Candidatus Kentron sp. FM]VFJ54876.1 MAG: cell division protein ZapA [Candidatus Kentron sp. FM]VFK09652.1 MAG: cell division protein ZapA [Candidatus Kentron sp. FM]
MSSREISPVTIRILDKEYIVSCQREEREDLMASARILDEQMRQARDIAKIYGAERIAVMSALNIIHEFLQRRREQEREEAKMAESVAGLVEKIDTLLTE